MRVLHSIKWKLTIAFLLIALISIALPSAYLLKWIEQHYEAFLRNSLAAECKLIGGQCERILQSNPDAIDDFAKTSGKELGRRITIIRSDGKVIGDSDADIHSMGNHLDRIEVADALYTGYGWSIRLSDTLDERMLYVAVRFGTQPNNQGVARISENLAILENTIHTINDIFLIAGLIAFVIAAALALFLSNSITTPVKEMSEAANEFAQGKLTHKLSVKNNRGDELDDLAVSLNQMAVELQQAINELSTERIKLQTILDKTNDGLLLLDSNMRIKMANPAAGRILGTSDLEGFTIIERVFNLDMAELIERVSRTQQPASLEVQLINPVEKFINVYAAMIDLPDTHGDIIVVMHDITDLKRIDSIRRDFVANVSHELRTPLASIRAMAETILLRSGKNISVAEEYATKIINEADRLTSISDDLLDLARIEVGKRPINIDCIPLKESINAALTHLLPKAKSKSIDISIDIPDDTTVSADAEALSQILTNLIDNAIKYTTIGGRVYIYAKQEADKVRISIADTGVGIPKADLPHIFERFYRVDKARSRESGGTGLGLSIVKHLVEAHGSSISVVSEIDKGSVFSFILSSGIAN